MRNECGYASLSLLCGEQKRQNLPLVKYWEIIADKLSKTGWSRGCVSTVDSRGRTIFAVDAHRDGQRFIVRVDEKLSASWRSKRRFAPPENPGCQFEFGE